MDIGTILMLAIAGYGVYAVTRNNAAAAPAQQSQAAAPPTSTAAAVAAATNLPLSNGLEPGVLPTGEIRIQAPSTPSEAVQAASAAGSSYQPLLLDGNWVNAPAGAATSLQQSQYRSAGSVYWRPQVLPTFSAQMLREVSYGFSPEQILAAAASERFENGGPSAFEGYNLPIGVWNWYRLQFDPGQQITQDEVNREVSASEYWSLVRASPIYSWNLSGLGATRMSSEWAV